MRRIVFIVLLFLLPIQFSWAAASGYCRHEPGVAAKHFGHHEHQHRTASGEVSKNTKAKSLGGADADCSICHFSTAQTVISTHTQFAPAVAGPPPFADRRHYDSHIPPGLERPNRGLAA